GPLDTRPDSGTFYPGAGQSGFGCSSVHNGFRRADCATVAGVVPMLSRSLLAFALSAVLSAAYAQTPSSTPAAAELADTAAPAAPATAKSGKGGVSIEDVRTFSAVYNLVKQAYVEDVGDKELMEAAIKGLLSGLDPHSEYLDARQWTELTEDTSG